MFNYTRQSHGSNMFRKLSLLALILILFSTGIGPVFALSIPISIQSNAAQGTSCPSNDVLRMTMEPIPQNINSLTVTGDSTVQISHMEDLSLGVLPLDTNGSQWWGGSLSDWISANANYTQWTFNVKPGLQWSNGQNVAAQDIKAWLSPDYALNPQYDFIGLHNEVVNVGVLNSSALTVYLNVSDAHFAEKTSMEYFAPVVSPSDVAMGPNATMLGNDVVDGPYYEANYTSGGTSMILLRNPYFHSPTPTACAIDINFVENAGAMIPQLVGDATDYAGVISFGNVAALGNSPNIHIAKDAGWLGTDMVYNITSYPYNMTEFRQALAYSINSSAIVQQALFGYGVPSNNAQGEVPATFASYNPSQPQYPYNVSAALKLLHSIGFTGGGSTSTPLKFANGTQMSTTIYTDVNKAWDVDVARQVVDFFQQLGMSATAQTLTSANLGADYASNAFNIQNNLVIYSSGGPFYVVPWLDAQQGCNVMGTPGCYGWFATPSADGQTQWEYPPSADVQYQSNLTAIDTTANLAQEHTYLSNIESLNAQYLPVIMLCYPDELAAYSTAHWTNWPGSAEILAISVDPNATAFAALVPVTSTSTSSSSSAETTSTTSTGVTSTPTTGVTSTVSTTSTTTPASNVGTLELIAGIVIIVIIIGGIGAYVMRRRSPTP
ncbi:MAG: ABC transporter substrate-binding protein [Nitrososphaerales archaeon]